MIRDVKEIQLDKTMAGTTPFRLVQSLLAGAIERIEYAEVQILRGNSQEKKLHINKASAIINELYSFLDFNHGGKLVVKLGHVYDFINCRLFIASAENNLYDLDECVKILTEIKAGWDELGEKQPTSPFPRLKIA